MIEDEDRAANNTPPLTANDTGDEDTWIRVDAAVLMLATLDLPADDARSVRAAEGAESDEGVRQFRDHLVHCSDMIAPSIPIWSRPSFRVSRPLLILTDAVPGAFSHRAF